MLAFVCILPFSVALLCLTLSRRVPTRWLGSAAGATLLGCGLALLVARLRGGLPLTLLDRSWVALESRSIDVTLRLDALSWAPALLVLAGGGLALLALALALPLSLRGFGGLFAAALLALLAIVAGLADRSYQFLPFLWATAALLVFLALRASGALAGSDAPVIVLLSGLCGALLALAAALLGSVAQPESPALQAMLVCWTLLGLLALGAPPLHAPLQELMSAPSALGGALLALGLPLLGGYTLIRVFGELSAPLTPGWRLALTLIGLLTLLICAAGAIRATRLRRMLGWQFTAQVGPLLIALGQGGALSTAIALGLLANAALATLACALATAVLERRAGTDELAEITLREPLALPGLVFLIGAASAAGLPGTWGLWPRRWLIEQLLRMAPWAIAPLLAGTALAALAMVAPLAAFWRYTSTERAGESLPTAAPPLPMRRGPTATALVGAFGAVPLLILGVAPQVAWSGWLAQARPALPGTPLALPGILGQGVCLIAALGLLGLAARARFGPLRPLAAGAQSSEGVVAPQALGESLGGLAWLGMATTAFAWVWAVLLRAITLLRRGLALFEQRYYLAGLVIAVIVVLMLFIQ
jgi:formate hydrogenlyase subunit 3/multisubunit Na+/H+ antiporter MnhD subunit